MTFQRSGVRLFRLLPVEAVRDVFREATPTTVHLQCFHQSFRLFHFWSRKGSKPDADAAPAVGTPGTTSPDTTSTASILGPQPPPDLTGALPLPDSTSWSAGVNGSSLLTSTVASSATTDLLPHDLPTGFVVDGPISSAMYAIDALHHATGLPWWATLCAYAVGVRVLLLPLTLKTMQSAQGNVPLMMQAFRKRHPLSALPGDVLDQADQELRRPYLSEALARFKALQEVHMPASSRWLVVSPLVHVTVFASSVMAVRRMALMNWPGWMEGGALCFPSLVLPAVQIYPFFMEPMGVLGAVLPCLMALLLKRNVENAFGRYWLRPDKTAGADFPSRLMRGLGLAADLAVIPVFVLSLFAPQGVVLYLASSAVMNLGMRRLVDLPALRQLLGVPVSSSSGEAAGGTPDADGTPATGAEKTQATPGAAPDTGKANAVDEEVHSFAENEVDVNSLWYRAAELRSAGKLAAALVCLQRITQLEPHNGHAYFIMARQHDALRQLQDSCPAYLKAAELYTNEQQAARAWYRGGIALHLTGRSSEGLEALARAEQLGTPQTALHALVAQAAVLKERGQLEEAALVLGRLEKLDAQLARKFMAELQGTSGAEAEADAKAVG